jgi:hypothetical protein
MDSPTRRHTQTSLLSGMGFRDLVEKAWKTIEKDGCVTPEMLAYELNLSPGYIDKVVSVLIQTRGREPRWSSF